MFESRVKLFPSTSKVACCAVCDSAKASPEVPFVVTPEMSDSAQFARFEFLLLYLGRAELSGAIRAGELTMSGPQALQRGLGRWFAWSAFAPASRSAQQRRTAALRLAGPDRVRIAP